MFEGKDIPTCIDSLIREVESAREQGRVHQALSLTQESQDQVGQLYEEVDALASSNRLGKAHGLVPEAQPIQGSGIWSKLYFRVEPSETDDLLQTLEERFTTLMAYEDGIREDFEYLSERTPVHRYQREGDEIDETGELLGMGTFVVPFGASYYHAAFTLSFEDAQSKRYSKVVLTQDPDYGYWCGADISQLFGSALAVYVIEPAVTDDIQTLFRIGCEKLAAYAIYGGETDGTTL